MPLRPYQHYSQFSGEKSSLRWLTRARIRAPFDSEITPLKRQDIPTPLTM
jgi:hypothetical protein